ncbi:glucose/arabinose dehydrogenase [Paucimonas lemoignei]|uniref:Glucose/arabinose dehydrogenase n=1 Tax=Paucimonas lemoignei TaxID=29443 RepID=A0A4R3HTX1_PAULE|nr:PQQ-dependent sugar dehydrogenase [Paucimonas lemoignei]TCS32746.1 glucose/arabinose dehydrogenase [Paucimonas lemoignei]
MHAHSSLCQTDHLPRVQRIPVFRRAAVAGLIAALAPLSALAVELRAEVVSKGLEHPWGLTFIDQGRMLVTERPGRLRLVQPDGTLGEPIQGVPQVDAGGQGGLHDVVADSRFQDNRTIYLCYAEAGPGGNSTAMASARLAEDGRRLEQVKVLFSQRPKVRSSAHFGCRIVEAKDGTLFLTLGERFSRKEDAQSLDNHLGKIIRVKKDGSVPPDNPFAGTGKPAGALPEIWSYGHRNIQGAALGPDGKLWIVEHGPQGGDEVNRIEPGKNYGWPVITYGENYGGGKIGAGITSKPGMEQPLHYWTPSIAPSGLVFLKSARYGQPWQGSLFTGSLKFSYLARLEMRDAKMGREDKLLQDLKQRIRDVREGPDGLLYVLTDESRGQLIRLRPGT